jgi:hypothetical protein
MAVLWGSIVLDERLLSTAYLGFVFTALGMCFIDGRIFKRKKR